jgi:ABC-type Fe3+-hydroxamate transport system substrate-binding protein
MPNKTSPPEATPFPEDGKIDPAQLGALQPLAIFVLTEQKAPSSFLSKLKILLGLSPLPEKIPQFSYIKNGIAYLTPEDYEHFNYLNSKNRKEL